MTELRWEQKGSRGRLNTGLHNPDFRGTQNDDRVFGATRAELFCSHREILGFSAGDRGVLPLASVEIRFHALAFMFCGTEIANRPEPKVLVFTFPLPRIFPPVSPCFPGINGKGKQTLRDKYFGCIIFLCVWVRGKYFLFPYSRPVLPLLSDTAGLLCVHLCASWPLPPFLLGA